MTPAGDRGPDREPGHADGLRRNHGWRALWLGQAVSLTGDNVFDITVLLWVATVLAKGRPWAPAAASGVLIAEAVPILAVGPLAGVWVDRWDRRRTMLGADACRAAAIASLLAVPALGARLAPAGAIAAVYAVVAAESCCAQFFNPSRLAVLGAVVRPAERVAIPVLGLVGVAFGVVNAAVPPLLLAAIPAPLIGRVMAVFNPVQQLANVVSMAAAGVLAGVLPVRTIFGVSALLVIAAGLALTRPFRSDVVPAEHPDRDQGQHRGNGEQDAR